MEFYLSPGALSNYPTPLEQTIWRVDSSVSDKLKLLLGNSGLGRFHAADEHLNLPIFFVTDEVLGKVVPCNIFTIITKRFLAEDSINNNVCPLPDKIRIPDKSEFNYKFDRIEQALKAITIDTDLQNPNNGLMNMNDDFSSSSDWLGMYCGYFSRFRCIIIRIDEIMRQPLLCNSIGVASVVLHELGHAIMDSPKHIQSAAHLEFRHCVTPFVANLIKYTLDESLANLVAAWCINGPSPFQQNAIEFMLNKQSFPYSLGAKFGLSKPISLSPNGLLREFTRYIVGWYKAKTGSQIEDVCQWIQLIFNKPNFTEYDLKDQIYALFNSDKPKSKKENNMNKEQLPKNCKESIGSLSKRSIDNHIDSNEIDIKDLQPTSEDYPFNREGGEIDGVYHPFKYGYANRNGRFVIEPRFDHAGDFSDKILSGAGYLAFVIEDGKCGIIRPDGTYFIEAKYNDIRPFHDGFAAVKINWCDFEGEWGFIKPDGSYLVPAVFTHAEDFHKGYAEVKTAENAQIFILPDGSRVLKSFDDITEDIVNKAEYDDEKVMGIPFKYKKGYIDKKGHWHDNIP